MTKYIVLSAILFGLFIFVGVTHAQTIGAVDLSQTMQEVKNAAESAQDSISVDLKAIPIINDASGLQSGVLGGGLGQGLSGAWNSFNTWTSQKIGISLGEIVSTILNFVMWVLNLFVKIVQAVINIIPR